ncbi:MAG: Cys-tRNA(Pro) deacylase [Sphaerochaetaceae bacterium]|jgi:Cys-tRNA(Pro)/Cys-tRNA(Cys) deacylase
MKTNAMRILDSLNIRYDVHQYPNDDEHLDAIHVAEILNVDAEQVCKTIVTGNDLRQVFVFCLPGLFDINLKRAKILTGSHEIELVKSDRLRTLTGYIRGGCSPLGMIRPYPLYVEESAQLFPVIYVSAGLRGFQISLHPDDLVRATNGTYAKFI